ncbi:MAG: 2-hydroxyacid dehydrogenase [Actinomycetota bacterium]
MAERPLLLVRYRIGGGLFDRVAGRCEVAFMDGPLLDRATDDQLARAWGVWTFGERIDADLLARMPALRCVVNFGVGVDGVDRAALAARGIAFVWPVGANAEAVADHALALILAVRHRIVESARLVRDGGWEAPGYLPLESADLHAARVGLVGLGAIGRATARRLAGFGAELAYATPRRQPAAVEAAHGIRHLPLDELLAWADIVSLHCPLTDETRGLIDARRIGLLRPGAVLVNTARGGVVDQDALVAALAEGRLGGAGLDVFADEPHVPPELRALPHVVLTPHVADATPGAEAALIAHCAAEALALLDAG